MCAPFCSYVPILIAVLTNLSKTYMLLPSICMILPFVDHGSNGSREYQLHWHCLTLSSFACACGTTVAHAKDRLKYNIIVEIVMEYGY